jgi:hypothetical protein
MTRAAVPDAAAAYEARATWWSALAINLLVVAGALDRLVSETGVSSAELLLRLGGIALSLSLLAALVAMRQAPRLGFARVAWALGILPFLAALPFLAQRYELQHRSWEPLYRHKLALLLIATLTPPRALIGLLPIGLLVVEALGEYWLLGLRHSSHLWPGEPLRTVVYALIAAALLGRRARDMQRERALVQREQDARVIERLARVALAVHDMTNTPLQTLVAGVELVAADPSQASRALPSMERAVDKLRSLNEALASYQKQVSWHTGDESFDPRQVIESAGGEPRRA